MSKIIGDKLLVEIDKNDFGFVGGDSDGVENGILVEVPDTIFWLGYHSFCFEESFMNPNLSTILDYYRGLIGSRVYWQSFQERGRRFKEGDKEYALINITDILRSTDPEIVMSSIEDSSLSGRAFK